MLKIASLFAPAVVALLVATSAGAQAPDPAKPGVAMPADAVGGGPEVALVRSGRLARRQGAGRRRRGHDRPGHGPGARHRSARAAQPDDRRQADLLGRPRYRAGNRLDLPARWRACDRQRGQSLPAHRIDHADRQGSRRRHQYHGGPRNPAHGGHAEPARRPRAHLDQADEHRPARQRRNPGSRRQPLASRTWISATRSCWPRPTSTPGRRNGAPWPRSAGIRSSSIAHSNTCTSVQSPSVSTSAAKSAC